MRYSITIGYKGHPSTIQTIWRRTRPAAYNAAYALWYEHLGVSGGRDTRWGWLGVEVLGEWLKDKAKVSAVCDAHDWQLAVVDTGHASLK